MYCVVSCSLCPVLKITEFSISVIICAGMYTRIFVKLNWLVNLKKMWTAGKPPSSGQAFIQRRTRYQREDGSCNSYRVHIHCLCYIFFTYPVCDRQRMKKLPLKTHFQWTLNWNDRWKLSATLWIHTLVSSTNPLETSCPKLSCIS